MDHGKIVYESYGVTGNLSVRNYEWHYTPEDVQVHIAWSVFCCVIILCFTFLVYKKWVAK